MFHPSKSFMPLVVVFAASLALANHACAASHYDVVKDFRLKSNPNGVWTYMDPAPVIYAHHSFEGVSGLENWSDDIPNDAGIVIAANKTGQTVMLEDGTLTFPADYLLIDTEQHNPGAIVQFQAPTAGSYTIKGNFFHLDSNEGRDVRISIILGSFESGPALFYAKLNHHNPQKFNVTTPLQAGQTLQFFVVRSPTEKPDYVGLQAKITGP